MSRTVVLATAGALALAAAVPAAAGDANAKRVATLKASMTKLEKRISAVAAARATLPPPPPGPQGPKGPTGDRGAVGPGGAPGVTGSSGFAASGNLGSAPATVVSVSIPGGASVTPHVPSYTFFEANVTLTNTGGTQAEVICQMKTQLIGNTWDTARVKLGAAASPGSTRTISLFHAFSAGAFSIYTELLRCSAPAAPVGSVTFSDADIVAIDVDGVSANQHLF